MSHEELDKLRRQEVQRRVARCRMDYNKLKSELDEMDFSAPFEKFERATEAGLLVAREELSSRLTQQFQLRMSIDNADFTQKQKSGSLVGKTTLINL